MKDPVLSLYVQYTEQYPDETPTLSIKVLEDEKQILGESQSQTSP